MFRWLRKLSRWLRFPRASKKPHHAGKIRRMADKNARNAGGHRRIAHKKSRHADKRNPSAGKSHHIAGQNRLTAGKNARKPSLHGHAAAQHSHHADKNPHAAGKKSRRAGKNGLAANRNPCRATKCGPSLLWPSFLFQNSTACLQTRSTAILRWGRRASCPPESCRAASKMPAGPTGWKPVLRRNRVCKQA